MRHGADCIAQCAWYVYGCAAPYVMETRTLFAVSKSGVLCKYSCIVEDNPELLEELDLTTKMDFRSEVLAFDCSPDGEWGFVATEGGTISVWKLDDLASVYRGKVILEEKVNCIRVLDESTVWFGTKQGRIMV